MSSGILKQFPYLVAEGGCVGPVVHNAVVPCIGPQESFNPLNYGTDLQVWLDATDTSTLSFNGSNVSQWDDKSGNGNHASQGVTAQQPLYVADGLNGKPALEFTLDGLEISDDASLDYADGITMFAVVAYPDASSGSANNALLIHKWVGGNEYSMQSTGHTSTPKMAGFGGQFVANVTHPDTIVADTGYVYHARYGDGDKMQIARNGGSETASGANVTIQNTTSDIIIGNRYNGEVSSRVSEILIYGEDLSAADIAAINAGLMNKYGVS